MAGNGSNQHTTPPYTEAECVERFLILVRDAKPQEGQFVEIDWLGLFTEWLRSGKDEYLSVMRFCKAKKVAIRSIQQRGGAQFWNQCRANIHAKALAIALEKSPEIIAVKYEKQLRIVGKLEDAIEHRVDEIRRQQGLAKKAQEDGKPQEQNPFEVSAINELIDGISELTKTNVLLQNGGVEKHDHRVLNLHGSLMEAIKKRDKELGVRE